MLPAFAQNNLPSFCTGKKVDRLDETSNVGDYVIDEMNPLVQYLSEQYNDGPVVVKVIKTILYKDFDYKEILTQDEDEIRIPPKAKATNRTITYINRLTGKPVVEKISLAYSETLKRYGTEDEAIKAVLNVLYWDTDVKQITKIDNTPIEKTKWLEYAGERSWYEQNVYHIRGPIPIWINDEVLETGPTPPYNKNNRVFIPYRLIFEALGAKVDYFPKDGPIEKVTGELNGKTIEMYLGQKTAYLNGEPYEMDVAPEIKQSRTFIPIRFAAEALGCKVEYVDISETKSWPRYVVKITTER